MKDMLKGIALALVAAYFFAFLFMLALDHKSESALSEAAIGGFIGIRISFWFVIPLGAALGLLIPWLFAGRGFGDALLGGALLGFYLGLVGGILIFGFGWGAGARGLDAAVRKGFDGGLLMGVYCAPWTGVYACLRRRHLRRLP